MKTAIMALATSLLLAGAAAAQDGCLAGAARLGDQRDLGRLRVAIEAACPCASFTGGPRSDRRAYRRCARGVCNTALASGVLRSECRAVATRGYSDTACGTKGKVPCGRVAAGSSKRPISCRIKSPGRCMGGRRYSEHACSGETHCSAVVDETAGTCVPVRESAYAPGWSAVHADASNTDYSAVSGASNLTLKWHRSFDGSIMIGPLEWTINLGPTIDPDGRVYLTSTVSGCHLQALDGATGDTLWCSPDVNLFAVISSPLLDRDRRLFLADGEAMHAFDTAGNLLWETPIVGVPLSAQFTPHGRVIFITHIGRIYVLRRDTGEPVLPPVELIPGATWDPAAGLFACARGTQDCPSANTPAIDLDTGRFFFTFWAPGAPQAGVRAMQITEDPEPMITALWANDSLPGGSASSPDVSADGTRLYVTDNVDGLHALDTATGQEIWAFPFGAAAGGSPSLSPDGLIIPSGGLLQAVRDTGTSGQLAWRDDMLPNRGIATQAAGGKAYATVARDGFQNDLVVVDVATGAELDREPLAGITVFSVGTTVGLDGTVYVPTIVGDLFAFRPE